MDTKGGKRWGGGGGGGMNWAIGIDMYTLMCIKWMTNKNLLYKKKIPTLSKKKSQINSLTLHLKKLGKEEETNCRVSRRNKITNIRVEVNETETRKTNRNDK